MSMIFPGMDPYLEDPLVWQGFHNAFVVHIRDHLQPLLLPRYVASVEERVFVEAPERREISPDVWLRQGRQNYESQSVALLDVETPEEVILPESEIHELFVSIVDRRSRQRVVTVIEVVSPTNKYPGDGRDSYVRKQKEVRASTTHLVEVDLLRYGQHVITVPEWLARSKGDYEYLICLNRANGRREKCEFYRCPLRRRLPRIRIPLADGDPDVLLDLQKVLAYSYEMGGYHDTLPYDSPCRPPLSDEHQAWANELIRSAGVVNPSGS